VGPFRVFRVFRGSDLADYQPNTMPNQSVEASGRPAARFVARSQVGLPRCTQTSFPAAVADPWRAGRARGEGGLDSPTVERIVRS